MAFTRRQGQVLALPVVYEPYSFDSGETLTLFEGDVGGSKPKVDF